MKAKAIKALAIAIDVGVPLLVTLTQFPVWISRSAKATVSGLAVFFIIISIIPLIRIVRKHIKTPAIWMIWGIMFLLFNSLRTIIDEMVIICFFGFLSNFAGEILYKYGEKISKG